jgi:hypothetical protein
MRTISFLVVLLLQTLPAFAASPFCTKDAHGQDILHFDALMESAASNVALAQEFSPSHMQHFFERMQRLAARDEVFHQKIKDAWCQGSQSFVNVEDLFVTDSVRKPVHEDTEMVGMRFHLLASPQSDMPAKASEVTISSNRMIQHDVHGAHILSENFELESFK